MTEVNYITGIDEAGRGCVIGPMVLAGVKIDHDKAQVLLNEGVKDSKLLTPKKRMELEPLILKLSVATHIVTATPLEIDRYCSQHRLDILEAEKMCLIIRQLGGCKIYIDAPGQGGKKFHGYMVGLLGNETWNLIAENHADINYPVVAAASILAKVERDRTIETLRQQWGDFGSGYPSDPKTRDFLRRVLQQKEVPDCIRKSWETVRKLTQ